MHDEAGKNNEAGDAFSPGADAFIKMWGDFANKMGASGRAVRTRGARPRTRRGR